MNLAAVIPTFVTAIILLPLASCAQYGKADAERTDCNQWAILLTNITKIGEQKHNFHLRDSGIYYLFFEGDADLQNKLLREAFSFNDPCVDLRFYITTDRGAAYRGSILGPATPGEAFQYNWQIIIEDVKQGNLSVSGARWRVNITLHCTEDDLYLLFLPKGLMVYPAGKLFKFLQFHNDRNGNSHLSPESRPTTFDMYMRHTYGTFIE